MEQQEIIDKYSGVDEYTKTQQNCYAEAIKLYQSNFTVAQTIIYYITTYMTWAGVNKAIIERLDAKVSSLENNTQVPSANESILKQELKRINRVLEAEKNEAKRLRENITAMTVDNNNYNTVKKDRDDLEGKVKKLKKEIERLKGELQKHQEQAATIRRLEEDLETACKERDEAQKKTNGGLTKKEARELHNQNEKLKNEINQIRAGKLPVSSKAPVPSKQDGSPQLAFENSELQKQIKRLEKELEKERSKNSVFTQSSDDLGELDSQIKKLEKANQDLEREKETLESSIQQLERSNQQLQQSQQGSNWEHKYQQLQDEAAILRTQKKNAEKELEKARLEAQAKETVERTLEAERREKAQLDEQLRQANIQLSDSEAKLSKLQKDFDALEEKYKKATEEPPKPQKILSIHMKLATDPTEAATQSDAHFLKVDESYFTGEMELREINNVEQAQVVMIGCSTYPNAQYFTFLLDGFGTGDLEHLHHLFDLEGMVPRVERYVLDEITPAELNEDSFTLVKKGVLSLKPL